jgi:2-polyprenyl-3-methyl-5-hydroxy-6-metoxy-1,4-benzoquinol methylase
MIEHVVIGHLWNPEGSEELRFGWQALKRQLPSSAQVTQTQALTMEALWLAAQDLLLPLASSSNSNSKVLLLAHPHLMLAPQTLAALQEGTDAAGHHAICWAFDSKHTQNQDPIEYRTWRGLERYAAAKQSASELQPKGAFREGALVGLVSLATLKTSKSLQELVHWQVPSAFAHDFSDYHSGSRSEVIHMVPSAAKKVLDVGGGDGGFLKALKQSHGCETHLAEQSAQSCEVARTQVDKVWEGDFFSTPISEKFDCVTFLDVLEHTTEPLRWLDRARGLLASSGIIVASIPNVGHWTVIADLLEGRWDYAPVGIHCITHLRFFTRHSIEALLDEAGFEIESLEATRVEPPPWWHTSGLKAATSNTLNIEDDNLSAYAFLVRAKLK